MKNPLIIENPALQSSAQRYGWGVVTFAFWMVYIYLWIPLITLLAWWVGAKLFNIHFIQLQGYVGLMDKLGLYLLIIFMLSALLIGWANVERLRFKDKQRRLGRPSVTVSDVAKIYNMQENQLLALRERKSIVVHFSDKGTINKVAEYHSSCSLISD